MLDAREMTCMLTPVRNQLNLVETAMENKEINAVPNVNEDTEVITVTMDSGSVQYRGTTKNRDPLPI